MRIVISALLAMSAFGQDVRKLSILHSNDLHARLLPDDKKFGGGLPVFEIANTFNLDAATLGNHEFDYGWRQIPLFLKVANGMRVAVIGVTMEDLANGFLTSVTSGPWKAQPVAAAARRVSAA